MDIPSPRASRNPAYPTNLGSPYDLLLSYTPRSNTDKNNEGRLLLIWRSPDINNVSHLNTTALLTTTPVQQNRNSSLEASLESQVPLQSDDCGLTKAHVLLNSYRSYEMNEEMTLYLQSNTAFSRKQERDNQLKHHSATNKSTDKHYVLEAADNHEYVVVTSTEKLDDTHYKKLAKLMEVVCDSLVTVMADYSNKLNKIKHVLESTMEIYNNQSEGLIESANQDVQLQYKELTNMLESLPLSQPLCILMNIDGILKGMDFQECFGPYSPYNLVEAVKRINRTAVSTPAATSKSRCSIM